MFVPFWLIVRCYSPGIRWQTAPLRFRDPRGVSLDHPDSRGELWPEPPLSPLSLFGSWPAPAAVAPCATRRFARRRRWCHGPRRPARAARTPQRSADPPDPMAALEDLRSAGMLHGGWVGGGPDVAGALRPLGLYRLHSAMSFCHLASSARLACHIIPQPPTLHLDRPTPLGALRLFLTGRPLGA